MRSPPTGKGRRGVGKLDSTDGSGTREGFATVDGASLFYRELGRGRPIVILHGGPDFDHNYLLPETDRLAGSFRLIYYDQRGRGRSAGGVRPEDVTITSEMEDLDGIRRHFGLESMVLLGHSWGGLLAMEYTTRHPHHVSHLILMNSAPANHHDYVALRQHLADARPADDLERMRSIGASAELRAGSIAAEAEYYRIYFRIAVPDPGLVDTIVARLRTNFDPETLLMARAIEQHLYEQTWLRDDYDLLPRLRSVSHRTLMIHGDRDFIPVRLATHISQAIPGSLLTVLQGCGHFASVEEPELVHTKIASFLSGGGTNP